MLYETEELTPLGEAIIKVLVEKEVLRKVVDCTTSGSTTSTYTPVPTPLPVSGSDAYVKSHDTLETIMERISRDFLGSVDDRKEWKKTLSEAVKEYGRDEIIKAFYEWCQSQGGTIIRKPVVLFLRNVGQNVTLLSSSKPLFTNPALTRVEERIAYISDNKVFFAGSYRIQLVALIKEHGENAVTDAFGEFFQNLEAKDLPWAARLFLERASVIIGAMKQRIQRAKEAEEALAKAYEQASKTIPPEEEDEEEEL